MREETDDSDISTARQVNEGPLSLLEAFGGSDHQIGEDAVIGDASGTLKGTGEGEIAGEEAEGRERFCVAFQSFLRSCEAGLRALKSVGSLGGLHAGMREGLLEGMQEGMQQEAYERLVVSLDLLQNKAYSAGLVLTTATAGMMTRRSII
jgi:hypothetical protein